jgi:hypothetical protein
MPRLLKRNPSTACSEFHQIRILTTSLVFSDVGQLSADSAGRAVCVRSLAGTVGYHFADSVDICLL